MKQSKKSRPVIYFSIIVLLSLALFATSQRVQGQNPECEKKQAVLKELEKQMEENNLRMEESSEFLLVISFTILPQESLDVELREAKREIQTLHRLIADGKISDEDGEQKLEHYRNRLWLIELRKGQNFDKESFINSPEFKEIQKDLEEMKISQESLELRILDLGLDLSNSGCAKADKQVPDQTDKTPSDKEQTTGISLQKITGLWRDGEFGNLIEITAGGTAVFKEVSESSASYGYKRGDVTLTGIRVVGNFLEAMLTTRADQEKCPSLGPVPVKATIKISSEGNTLSLTAPSRRWQIENSTCRLTNQIEGTINRTYTRVQ